MPGVILRQPVKIERGCYSYTPAAQQNMSYFSTFFKIVAELAFLPSSIRGDFNFQILATFDKQLNILN